MDRPRSPLGEGLSFHGHLRGRPCLGLPRGLGYRLAFLDVLEWRRVWRDLKRAKAYLHRRRVELPLLAFTRNVSRSRDRTLHVSDHLPPQLLHARRVIRDLKGV